jgi:O-antigen/teichoic acid export membrane protein
MTDAQAPSPGSTAAAPQRQSLSRAAVMLGVATTSANVLGYAFAVVLSRSLGPAAYGALAALLAAGLIGSIPGVALQLAVARSAAEPGEERAAARWFTISLAAGAVLLLATWALAPVAVRFLALEGPAPVLWLGVVLLPTTVTGAFEGRLLGREQHARLSLAYLTVAGLRFVSGLVAAHEQWSITGALAAAAVASVLACLVCATLAGLPARAEGGASTGRLVRELVAASSSTAAILVLANVDVVLARHYLDATGSGHYAVGNLFTKAAFWGPHFLAVLAYPRLARTAGRRRALLAALGLTVAIGVVVVAGAAVLGLTLIDATAGHAYADIAPLAPAFALLGTLMAVLQLTVYSGLARRRRIVESIVWAGIAAEVMVVAGPMHGSPGQILAACVAVNLVLAAAAVTVEVRRADVGAAAAAAPDTQLEQEAVIDTASPVPGSSAP